ncbi:hypothetical protein ABT262_29915, partial [Amycolatopsis mediterranei]
LPATPFNNPQLQKPFPSTTPSVFRQLLGGGLWPQIMLRLGHGTAVPSSARTPLEDVVISDEHPFAASRPGGARRRGSR